MGLQPPSSGGMGYARWVVQCGSYRTADPVRHRGRFRPALAARPRSRSAGRLHGMAGPSWRGARGGSGTAGSGTTRCPGASGTTRARGRRGGAGGRRRRWRGTRCPAPALAEGVDRLPGRNSYADPAGGAGAAGHADPAAPRRSARRCRAASTWELAAAGAGLAAIAGLLVGLARRAGVGTRLSG